MASVNSGKRFTIANLPAEPRSSNVSSQSLVSSSAISSSTTLGLKAELDVEKQNDSSNDSEDNKGIPDKVYGRVARNLRHQIFSIYRRLFGVVFVANIAVFIWILLCQSYNYNAQFLGGIVIANVFASTLMRQEYVVNAFFLVFCSVPTSWPWIIRQACARVYHIGGLHSGFAVSGLLWLLLFTAQATKEVIYSLKTSVKTLVISYCILSLFLVMIISAHPTIRQKYHNYFENTHRFLGWTATILVWLQFIFLTIDYKDQQQPLSQVLVKSPYFWLLVILTCSIILPWIRLRKVAVRSEVLSKHALRLYLDKDSASPGCFTRVSHNPLLEWHSFASVPVPGENGYSLIISRAGDWTSKEIENPPSHIWVRGIPTYGMLSVAPLFKKIVLVATGSGIAPCVPWILQRRVPIKLLWTSPDVRETFGDNLVDAILEAAPDAVIYDTRKHGRPDLVELTYNVFKDADAEAVCIISNEKLTRKVVYGMVSRGIPAFGPIWDS